MLIARHLRVRAASQTARLSSMNDDSDHEPFAVVGIPSVVVYADDGGILCDPDEHQTSDTSDKREPHLMQQIAQFVSATAVVAARRGGYCLAFPTRI